MEHGAKHLAGSCSSSIPGHCVPFEPMKPLCPSQSGFLERDRADMLRRSMRSSSTEVRFE